MKNDRFAFSLACSTRPMHKICKREYIQRPFVHYNRLNWSSQQKWYTPAPTYKWEWTSEWRKGKDWDGLMFANQTNRIGIKQNIKYCFFFHFVCLLFRPISYFLPHSFSFLLSFSCSVCPFLLFFPNSIRFDCICIALPEYLLAARQSAWYSFDKVHRWIRHD